jgi:hypothetical protein
MTIRDVLLAALLDRFSDQGFQVGTPDAGPQTWLGDPTAWFPAKHPEVGEIRIWVTGIQNSTLGTVLSATVSIGQIIVDSFHNYDSHLDEGERVERVTNDVVRFLGELFADRLLFWRSTDGRRTGWRERGDAGYSEPLVLDDREYRTYVWSGPLSVWQAIPAILARGRIQDDREYQIIVTRLADEGPEGFRGAERDLASRLAVESDRDRDGMETGQ